MIRTALEIRRFEERLLALYEAGQIGGTIHTCIGQEWSAVAVVSALRDTDYVISNHRSHGHYLAQTGDVHGLMAEIMGRTAGICGGRGGSQHLYRRRFLSNGILAGMMPLAAGLSLANKLRGDSSIATVFVGDGALGEGVFYETLNIAALWQLPLLVVVENNGYAQSTERKQSLAGDIRTRAQAFGIAAVRSTTWDWRELVGVARQAVDRVRTGAQPVLLQIDTYRLAPHSKGDDSRPSEEVSKFASIDPVNMLLQGTDSGGYESILNEIDQELDSAVAAAQASEELHVVPTESDYIKVASKPWQPIITGEYRIGTSLNNALRAALERDNRIVMLGEDIRSPYGGAFKITRGLSDAFPDRVLNTPDSEAAIVGLGCGLALAGFVPVVEIMFGDFMLLAADQLINHAAKFEWMYNDQVRVPLIIRSPMGAGRGYGPTHSQNLEKHFLGVPGTTVLALNPFLPPEQLYRRVIEDIERPTIIIEGKTLYGQIVNLGKFHGYRVEANALVAPTVRITPEDVSPEVTLVAYGNDAVPAADALLRVFEQDEVVGELIVPSQLYPLDIGPILASVMATRRLVVVEGGQGFAGLAGEIIAQIVENGAASGLVARREVPAASPIPAARNAERGCLPSVASLTTSLLQVVRGEPRISNSSAVRS